MASKQARPGRFVFVQVSDDGHGMDQETIERIFDPFFSTKFEGRGLGLAAVLGIAQSHGGALSVKSEPGRGTTFRLYLPSVVGVPSIETKEVAPKRDGMGRHVLLADDEPEVRKVVKRMLEGAGYSVIDLPDGQAAVDAVRDNPGAADLILLDITMPLMGGVEACNAIRDLGEVVPIVFMTGYDHANAGGEVIRLLKPFSSSELIRRVESELATAPESTV